MYVLCRMFVFGKPYFSGNSLVRSFKFDPPPYQTTNTFLTTHPGTIDPSNPRNASNAKHGEGNWPPDPLRLYYSPFSPHDGFLSLDSRREMSFMWKQDRWYVDMRGDVDQEGWEYAFYWNGRWRWCGGNWHGQARFIHAWVRRRKWVRQLIRKPVHPRTCTLQRRPVSCNSSSMFEILGVVVDNRPRAGKTFSQPSKKKLAKVQAEVSTNSSNS